MNQQLDIFEGAAQLMEAQAKSLRGSGVALYRKSDPHTSKQAAKSVAEVAGKTRAAILNALRLYGASTAHELATHLAPLDSVQITRRLSELHADQKITRRVVNDPNSDEGLRYHTRNSPSGRPACVWYLK